MPEFEIKEFSAGYIDGIDSNLIPPNAAKWSQNWLSRTLGKLEKRSGQEALYAAHSSAGTIQGMHGYYEGIGLITRTHLIACGGDVGYWSGTPKVFTALKTLLNTTALPLFETCVNYVVVFNGVDAPWKWDGTSVSALANAPADGRFPTLFKEKLFVVPKSDPSNLRWSDSFLPESWPGVNYWPVKDGDGDEITGLQVFLDELVIFKNHSIHSLRGTSLDDFRLDELDRRVGCVGPFASVPIGNRIYFIGHRGIYEFNGMSSVNISDVSIPNFWSRVNEAYLNRAVAGVHDEFIWFALPIDSSTTNNIVLAYFPGGERGTWWPLTGINVSCMLNYDTGTGIETYTGGYSGIVAKQNPSLYADFGAAYTAQWKGFDMDGGRAENEKKIKRAFMRLSPGIDPPGFYVSQDEGAYEELAVERTDTMVSRHRFTTKRFRYLSPMLQHSTAVASEVRGMYAPFKMKRKPKVRVVAAP